ncbi:MAG: isoprenylcysteine carboxylmethyltransferase family protein [Thermodesulfobacteriota bacterium]|nr:isoprenylcysteine carboxylmethyltransferase family protein [Thermodesulfobacteriota bacterium]
MKKTIQSIHSIFNNKKTRKTLVKFRLPIALIFILIVIFHIKREFFFYGMAISFFGEFIQVWCFAALDKQKTIAAKGLYAVTRNPMYIGRYFIILGAMVLTGNIFIILIYTLVYYFYMVNRVKREEKTLKNIFGTAYTDYCRHVNRFLPSFGNKDLKSLFFFKWSLFFQNNAHWNILSVGVTYMAVYYIVF